MCEKKKIIIVLSVIVLALMFGGLMDGAAAEKKLVIVVDPAHGGKDAGIKLDDDVSEKNITLSVALLLKKELAQDQSVEIILTRDSDKGIDAEDRRQMIEKSKPDFFISLHVNSGFGKNASGFEIYYPDCSVETTDDKKTGKDELQKIKNKCQNDSLRMAKLIEDNLNRLFPRKGRGLRKADLPVTDGMMIPALSVEMGFASNPEDKKKLLSGKIQADIARAMAKSIKTFGR